MINNMIRLKLQKLNYNKLRVSLGDHQAWVKLGWFKVSSLKLKT